MARQGTYLRHPPRSSPRFCGSRKWWSTERAAQLAHLLGLEPPRGQPQHVPPTARPMIGGDEVIADPQREGEHAAGLDVVLVRAEGTEQRAQVVHSPVVDASEAAGDHLITSRPVADCEV